MKLKFLLFRWKWYALIFLVSGLSAFILDKNIELLLFFICYANLRYMFPKTFHHNQFYHCIFWSIVMMVLAAYTAVSKNISVLSVVMIAYIVGIVLCYIQDYLDKVAEIQNSKILANNIITLERLHAAFVKYKTPLQYRDYLKYVLIEGYKDVDWFNLDINRDNFIDEQQYRNYKCKFLKKIRNENN